MKTFAPKRKLTLKEYAYRAFIFLATVGIIVYFLPREGKFNYLFEVGKPWKYGLLQATFDFPIYKAEAQIEHERDSVKRIFAPYFNVDPSIGEKMVEKFKDDCNDRLSLVIPGESYRNHIEKGLKEVYKKLLVSPTDLNYFSQDSLTHVRIVEGNTSRLISISSLTTFKQAYEEVAYSDTVHFSKKILQYCNIDNYIQTNLVYDESKSQIALNDLLASISEASGFVINGQKIIDQGEIISEETYQILRSMEMEWGKRGSTVTEKRLTMLGQGIFVAMVIAFLFFYLELYRSDYFQTQGSIILLLSITLVFSVVSSIAVEYDLVNIYVIPFAMLPVIVRIFLDSRTAFMTHTMTVLICSLPLNSPYEFILLQTMAGLVGIYSLRELSQRSQIVRSAVIVTVAYCTVYFAIDLIQVSEWSQLSTKMYLNFLANGLLLMFTYPLLFILEKLFGFTSNVTLVELSNINTPLMRRMSEVAPGTFQHSLQLANLTAAAANRIDANSQLVRTGAMYHDIGKMLNPAFFTENQSGINPHDNCSYRQSAQVIISHVTDGLKLAEKHSLPQVIRDFIATHHGAGLTKYFYISDCNDHPGETVDKAPYQYPGPNPFTKEQAILMMADAVEAASRSLKEYTEESISGLVDKIIDGQVADGFFKECPITFSDIAEVKAVFKDKLKTMYHTRVKYPELKK